MRGLSFVLLFFILFFSSCNDAGMAPEDLIPPQEMAYIIKDMVLLEATYNTRLIRVKNKSELMKNYSSEILNEHSITKENFDSSYDYYVEHSEEFEEILELVFEELNKMETETSKFNTEIINSDSTITVILPEDN